MRRKVIGYVSFAVAMAVGTAALAAFQVKEAPENCRNAHAILVASKSGQHDFIWGRIAKVARSDKYAYEVVEDYEPGVSRRVSFRQYDTKYVAGGAAYVVHCGHGATCNQLAKAFLADNPDWYGPEVYCGPVPHTIENPKRVSF
jgi:hypothetical protein